MQSAFALDESSEFIARLSDYAKEAWAWIDSTILTYATLGQLGVAAGLLGVGYLCARPARTTLDALVQNYPVFEKPRQYIAHLVGPIMALLLASITVFAGRQLGWPVFVLDSVRALLVAWIVIRFAANFIENRTLGRFFAVTAWTVAALEIFTLLDPLVAALKGASVTLGDTELSAFDVIWGAAAFVFFVWAALLASKLIENRLYKASGITPSARVLIAKVAKIALVSLAFLLALNSTGIDLTALAVFGGALGVGLGFGLQKVVSNFISGVILLVDRSIKPGDVIEVQGTYGEINSLAARYTSVVTRDGTEYLIPNEDMITQPVINWSHSNTRVRRRLPINVAYGTELREAMRIMVEAAKSSDRVLNYPEPRALLIGFGDNGVDLQLRMWIEDPQNGVANVSSDVLLEIWDRFHEAGIEFPFPQRVIHYADGPNAAGKPENV